MKKIFVPVTVIAISLSVVVNIAIASDLTVIVNKENNNTITKALVAKIYTGQISSWPEGGSVNAIDLSEDNPTRAAFSSKVVGKSLQNLKAMWAQNIFTGKAVPPRVVDSDEEVKKIVVKNKNAIGYVKASSVDDSVKVVLSGP